MQYKKTGCVYDLAAQDMVKTPTGPRVNNVAAPLITRIRATVRHLRWGAGRVFSLKHPAKEDLSCLMSWSFSFSKAPPHVFTSIWAHHNVHTAGRIGTTYLIVLSCTHLLTTPPTVNHPPIWGRSQSQVPQLFAIHTPSGFCMIFPSQRGGK